MAPTCRRLGQISGTEISNHTDHWVVEMAIPFKTLRYKLVAAAKRFGAPTLFAFGL